MSRRYVGNSPKNCTVSRLELHCYKNQFSALLCLYSMSRRVSQPSLSNCSRILRAMILGLDYTVYTLLPIITMEQFSLKPTNRPNKPVLYSYNICAVPRRLELENGINRRPNQNQASVTVYHLYQFSPIFWHYFIGLQ